MKPGHRRSVPLYWLFAGCFSLCRMIDSLSVEAEVCLRPGLETQTNCPLGSEVHQDPGQSWINLRLWESQLNGILRFLAKAA